MRGDQTTSALEQDNVRMRATSRIIKNKTQIKITKTILKTKNIAFSPSSAKTSEAFKGSPSSTMDYTLVAKKTNTRCP